LSLATGKPLSVHARDSVPDVLAMLEPHLKDGLKAIWHCFVAGKKDIGPALDFAIANRLCLAVGGLVTFEDQKPLREHVARIPDELLLLETDAPYLVPRPRTTDRNTPAGVIRVAEVLAGLRGVDAERIRAVTTANADALLGEWR
jgi:TatD DNase family protein